LEGGQLEVGRGRYKDNIIEIIVGADVEYN
jgi:hypothetical protein